MSPLLILHVCAAVVTMLSGYTAMLLRKGSGLHAAAGTIFSVSILTASGAGAYLAAFVHPNSGNVIGSTLTFYLAATGWVAARRRNGKPGLFDLGALLFGLAIAATALTWGFEAIGTGPRDRYPAPFYFIFGSIALLFSLSDIRMMVRGGVVGAKRIARHLWRNCFALLFATISFYPGQAKFFPKWIRATNLLHLPTVLLAGAMLLWLYRVSVRKRVPQIREPRASQREVMVGNAVAAGRV